MRKNADHKAWASLRERWAAALSAACEAETAFRTEDAYARHERQAFQELLKLDGKVKPDAVTETVLALYMLQEDQPRRLRSDAAFDHQLTRRVRALTDVNAGEYWDNARKRTKRVYRDLPPRTVSVFADCIKTVFGVAGLYVARLEQQDRERADKERQSLHAALQDLK